MPQSTQKDTPGKYLNIQFRAQYPMRPQLEARTAQGQSINLKAHEEIERYYALLERGRRILANEFSVAEISAMMDSCNGTLFETTTIHLVYANIEDGIALDELAQKWEIDGDRLVERLKALPPCALFALVDCIEQWWKAPDSELSASGFGAVGLVARKNGVEA